MNVVCSFWRGMLNWKTLFFVAESLTIARVVWIGITSFVEGEKKINLIIRKEII